MTSMGCCCWGNGSWMTSSVKMVANWKNIHLHSRGANSWQGNLQLFAPASLRLCQGINAALRAFTGSYFHLPQSCGVQSKKKNCHNLKKYLSLSQLWVGRAIVSVMLCITIWFCWNFRKYFEVKFASKFCAYGLFLPYRENECSSWKKGNSNNLLLVHAYKKLIKKRR